MADIDEIIAKFKEVTRTECVRISASKGETTPYESSFGGTPYLPKDFVYPYAENYDKKGDKIPMALLAQINFEEVPRLENFPEKGILQIFINPADDMYGVDFDKPTSQKDYKIFYHADIDKNPRNQQEAPNAEDEYSPVLVPLRLGFEIAEDFMNSSDDRFDELFVKLYNEETGSDYKTYNMPDEIMEKVYDKLSSGGHKLGGYPFFTQSDPRYDEEYSGYDTLLLQIDSDSENGEDLIMWGDSGVCNFFVKAEDLKNRRFGDVMYNWDCL